VRAPAPDRIDDEPVELIPADAPPLRDHPTHGAPSAEYRYGDHFVVQRFDFLDPQGEPDKTFVQWSWRGGTWAKRGTKAPHPLYHAHLLKAFPTSPVLVVEGEKCVEMAQPLLGIWVVTTWAGGAGAIKKADWSLLKGRDVTIWPDADLPGREAGAKIAALLANTAARVRAVNPNGADPGWDVAAAIESGWDKTKLIAWMKGHMAPVIEGPKKPEQTTAIEDEGNKRALFREPKQIQNRTIDADSDSKIVTWDELGLRKTSAGLPHTNTANGSAILQRHPTFRGQLWFDDFCGEVFHTLRGAAQPWTDLDTRRVTVFVQEQMDLYKFTISMMHDAVMHAAECNIRNPVTEWLDGLKWDGMKRLDNWLADCAGVEFNDYSKAIARNWLIALVARAYRPGCKMDNMPVLEGVSGLNKTQFLEVLGGEWYKALPMEFGSKDFKQALRGAWVVEIPDMTGFGRVAHSAVLAELSIPIDVYRQSYGRRAAKYPRTCVICATSETSDYLTDARGKRRYWPVRCTDINLDGLRHQREDLFAEAVHAYREGEKWYLMPESATNEQLARTTDDPWDVYVLPYAEELHRQSLVLHDKKITTEEILVNAIGKKPADLTQADKRRVAQILKTGGYVQPPGADRRHWIKSNR
jgi:predicted P-loop ATPase